MRICLLSDGFPSENIQYFVFVEQLVNALVDLGNDVDVIAPQSITNNIIRNQPFMPMLNIHKTPKGIEYRVFRPKFISVGNNKLLKPIATASKKKTIERALNIIGIKHIDVFYGHFWHNAYAFKSIAKKYSKPLFVACGEGDNALEDLVSSFSRNQLIDFRKSVTGVISVSSENKRKCIDLELAANKNVVVLPNCVDQQIFHQQDRKRCRNHLNISSSDFVVMFVGGFIHRKGSARLSQALKEINDPNIKAFFIGSPMGGDGDIPDYPQTIFQGQLSHEKLPEYLSACDVFVLPTLKEGCCNAIVEALSCGAPVVSSNGTFNDDILDAKCSIRIDPMSVEEIKNAILKIKNSHELREEMSEAALEKSKEWSITKRAQNILDFIKGYL